MVGTDASADVLGISGLRGGGEADEVTEEDGDDLALLLHGAAVCSVRGAVQKPQNWKPSGFSLPQDGQVGTPSLGARGAEFTPRAGSSHGSGECV